jgi:hypothetical protein
MKTRLFHFFIGLALLGRLTQTVHAAVAFTITPSAISNTYSGPITLQITGLTAGETVVVQKYLDANTNGVVDAGDILWQQFNLTDGTNFVIGGVTNNNVPGDTDGTANGQITAKLNFKSDFSQTIAGQYFFELSSPSNHFTAITNSFTVTNFPYAQQFTGTVVSNGVAVPNAAILLFPSSGPNGNNNPVGGAVANNSGIYTIRAPAGSYSLIPFKANFVANFATAPVFTLGNNATFNTNLSLFPTTKSISGKFVDASNSAIGLPGLLVPVQTQNRGLLGICFTDTNGNFTLGVSSNQWGISGQSAGLAFHGYVGWQNKTAVDTTTGSVSGVTLALSKATAFFYGTVKDNLGNPLPGEVAVEAYDNNNNIYQSDGYADTNGNYVTAVLGGLASNDPWWVSVDNSSSFPNYIFSQPAFDQNGGDNIKAGKAVQANITAILATHTISGNVKTNGNAVIGVGVSANATIGGVDYNLDNVDTDANGNYSLAVANGNWNVNVSCQGGSDSLDSILGSGNYQCPNSQSVTINNSNATGVNFIVQLSGSDQIFGYLTDGMGSPIVGVNVYANDGKGDIYTNSTDDTGYYSFNVADGNWDISVDCGQLTGQSYPCVSDQDVSVCCGNSVEVDFTTCDQPFQITTTNLPTGVVNVPYDQFLQASSCNGNFTWSVNDPQDLPPGLQLASSGELFGTPTNGGMFSFTVSVTDGNNNTTNQMLSLVVNGGPLQVATTSLPNGTNGTFYSQTLQAAGGLTPYNWSLAPGSAGLPASLVLATNGVISGTPGLSGTNFEFIVQVTDASTNSAQQLLSLTIVGSSNVPAIVLTAPKLLGDGQFEFIFNTVSGGNYTIQYCTTLGDWIDLMTLGGSGAPLTIIDPNPAGSGERFYRVKTGP